MLRNLYLIILFALLLSACKNDQKEKVTIPLRFEKKSLVQKSGAHCDTAEYDCSIIALNLVRAKGPADVAFLINKNLDDHIINLVSTEGGGEIQDLEVLTEKFLADQREASKNFSEEPPWEAYIDEKIYFHNEKLVSIGITTEIFTGGAHGYKTQTFLNLDPNTGEVLTKKELFEPEFSQYVEDLFRSEKGIPAEANINSTGFWFEGDRFSLPENLGFTEDSLILVYNSYEIAPYASGEIVLKIPRIEASKYLKLNFDEK